VARTVMSLGAIYLVIMLAGSRLMRTPPPGWLPDGWIPQEHSNPMIATTSVSRNAALRTPQFWLLWAVLCLNVTAGIGVLGQASAMIQEVFRGRIDASAAAGFVGLLSLFNMGGRFFWSSLSDRIGRKATYAVFFGLGSLLYASVPFLGRLGSVGLFVGCFAVILTMYGGGFATIPAYLSDLFGTRYVGAIHGRLLTAWSAAGVFGPVLVNYIRQYEVDSGVATAQAYNHTMWLMAGLLVIGLVCNLAVRPVHERHHLVPARSGGEASVGAGLREELPMSTGSGSKLVAAWTGVAVPLAWGVLSTLQRALTLFRR